MLRLTQIERSRAESPVVRSREGLEALRSLALRLLRDLEPVNDRSAYFDARLFEDSVSSLDIVRLIGGFLTPISCAKPHRSRGS